MSYAHNRETVIMSDRMSLSGQVAAVTGAASGIGRCLAFNLADEGCHVAIADVDEKGLRETAMAKRRLLRTLKADI